MALNKIFITGGSGFVGPAVITELIDHGYQVVALARSDASADKLKALGVSKIINGSVEDVDMLVNAAKECDGVIHMAFNYDYAKIEAVCASDIKAMKAIADAYRGTNKPLINTNGTLNCQVPIGHDPKDEDDPLVPHPPLGLRLQNEIEILKYTDQGVRVMSVRLSPTVHDKNDAGFIAIYGGISQQLGVAGYIDEGLNQWTAVHRKDAARLYRLVLENGEAGHVYHAASESLKFKDIAQTVGDKLHLSTTSFTPEEALNKMGLMGHVFVMNAPLNAVKTRKALGWAPKEISLFEDIQQNYFN